LVIVDCIVSGKMYWRGELVDAAIAIDDGKIFDVGLEVNLPKADKYYRFPGKIILPGLIDVHVHLRDQELSYKETFESGTMAAAAGGFTTVLDMPNNSPLTDSPSRFIERVNLAKGRIYVNVGFYSLFPKSLSEVETIAKLGAIGFKVYLNRRYGFLDPSDDDSLKQYLHVCSGIGIPVVFHAEDYSMISRLEDEFKGLSDFRGFMEAHSIEAEFKAVERILRLACASNCGVHIAHVTSGLIVDLISKFRGIATCEVTPHHLFLTHEALHRLGGIAKMEPPLRGIFDVISLWDRIRSGFVDVVADDHAPHAIEEKSGGSFWDIKSGIPGLETTLPLMLTAVNYGLIGIGDIVKLMNLNPSKIFDIEGKGSIEPGFDADLTVVDLDREWIIDSSKFYSKAKFSPFDGFRVRGMVKATFVNGLMVYDGDEIVCKGGEIVFGRRIRG